MTDAMRVERLNAAISAVCPVTTVSMGSASDRATWQFTAAAGATAQQVTNAQTVIDTIVDTPEAQTAWDLQQRRNLAAAQIGAMAAMVSMAGLRTLAARINLLSAMLGQDAITDSDLTSSLAVNVSGGLGDSGQIPNMSAKVAMSVPRQIATARVAVSATAAGATRDVTVTWASPFADANYTLAVVPVVNGNMNAWVTAKTASGCTVRLQNLTGLLVGILGSSLSGTLDVIAVHD